MDFDRNRLYDCTNLDDSLIGKRGIGKDYMREIINVVNSINKKDININDSRIRKLVSITHLTNRPFGYNTHEDGIDSSQFFYLLPEPKKTMFNLNELCVIAYENAAKREVKDGKVSTETRLMLKHTATEVVEAAEAYNSMVDGVANKEIFASELADIICCVLIIAGKENIDMEYALTACMEKNYKRAIGEGDK